MTNTTFEKKFAYIVRNLRGNRSQLDYAKELDVARVTVSNWERGKITDLPTLARLAHAGGQGRILVEEIFALILDDYQEEGGRNSGS